MESWEPREVHVRVVPTAGYRLEIQRALHSPFVTQDDMDDHGDRVIEDLARVELYIPDDVPVVLMVTESDGTARRIECPPST
ncbi:hypothetical protein ABTZ03_31520 [Kitasatospora sp. NPDC096077]|uniref:hypothetical protein n=1 Tax=Kitasatospora sp. NPDC096077 TaxID=3155544 RepID=UPI003328ECBB